MIEKELCIKTLAYKETAEYAKYKRDNGWRGNVGGLITLLICGLPFWLILLCEWLEKASK